MTTSVKPHVKLNLAHNAIGRRELDALMIVLKVSSALLCTPTINCVATRDSGGLATFLELPLTLFLYLLIRNETNHGSSNKITPAQITTSFSLLLFSP